MASSALVELEEGDFDLVALVHIKCRIRLAINVAAATKGRVIEVPRRETQFASLSYLGATYEHEGAGGAF